MALEEMHLLYVARFLLDLPVCLQNEITFFL